MPGPCAGMAPARIIAKLLADATGAATSTNGFSGDPLHPIKGIKYFGYMLNASSY